MPIPVSRPYVVVASVMFGGVWLASRPHTPEAPAAAAPADAGVAPQVAAAVEPALPSDPVSTDEPEAPEEPAPQVSLDDPAAFALVFSVHGTSYVQLGPDERGATHGTPRLYTDEDVVAVVADVPVASVPDEYRAWAGRRVLVDGTCAARVVGFAEVSRVSGEPPSNDYEDDKGEWHHEELPWTVDDVTQANVILAGVLDGCDGSWARASDLPPAVQIAEVSEPELEAAAREQLLSDADGVTQKEWEDQGAQGNWREMVDVATHSYRDPKTGDTWIFATATHGGGCGEPSVSLMRAYRSSAGGGVEMIADLGYAYDVIHDVVDIDGDGQPELLVGGGNYSQLIDLANEGHASINVPILNEGCGC